MILYILFFTDKVVLIMTYVVIPVECLSGSQCHTLTLCSLVRFLRGPVYILEWFQSGHPNPMSFRESVCATNPKCLCRETLHYTDFGTLEFHCYIYNNHFVKKSGFDKIALVHDLQMWCDVLTFFENRSEMTAFSKCFETLIIFYRLVDLYYECITCIIIFLFNMLLFYFKQILSLYGI